MSARLLMVAACVALFAAGCTTSQPTAFIPAPVPPHPTGYAKPAPAPAQTQTALQQAPAPQPVPFSGDATMRVVPERQWTTVRPIDARLDLMGKVTCITIHHEGEADAFTDQKSVVEHLEGIQKVHINDRHYGDIAYHFLIDCNGTIYEGRPLQYQGAHAGNQVANKGNIGICLLGDFDRTQPTPAQKDTLKRLVCKLMAQYDVPVQRVYTHCEVKERCGLGHTDCPGKYLQAYVNQLRNDMKTASR